MTLKPDLVILDMTLDSDDFSLMKRLKAQDESLRIMVWSMEDEHASRAIEAGAHGYINKMRTKSVFDAIREVMAGKIYRHDDVEI
jgi:DNA-binding NarL/FixJ family response regulator